MSVSCSHWAALLVAATALLGCGGGSDDSSDSPGDDTSDAAADAVPDAGDILLVLAQ